MRCVLLALGSAVAGLLPVSSVSAETVRPPVVTSISVAPDNSAVAVSGAGEVLLLSTDLQQVKARLSKMPAGLLLNETFS